MPYVPPRGTKPIPGFHNYVVSADGVVYSNRVYGSKTRRTGPWWVMKPKTRVLSKHTYVDLFREIGKPERFFIHQLILLAFVGPCPEGQQCRHLNDIANDNRLENLAYGTHKQNREDGFRNGRVSVGERHYNATLTNEQVREIRRLRGAGKSLKDIASTYGKTPHYIYRIARRDIWRHV